MVGGAVEVVVEVVVVAESAAEIEAAGAVVEREPVMGGTVAAEVSLLEGLVVVEDSM